MDYNAIYDFCKVRNAGPATSNGTEDYTPRIKFLISLIESLGLEYEIDTFELRGNNLHNIYLKGSSDKWVMAHHDVCNPNIDNANDNSASVINCIGLKTIRPDINVALVDGEEPPVMGGGSNRFGEQVKKGNLKCSWVLNLELSGIGGENFFIGKYGTDLTKKIQDKFQCDSMNVPFNDAAILIRNHGIDAALINPCPLRSYWEVTQLGSLTEQDFGNDNLSLFDELEEKWYEINNKMSGLDPNSEEYINYDEQLIKIEDEMDSIQSDAYSGWSYELSVGDKLSEEEYKIILRDIPNNVNLDDSDPNKFICKYVEPNIQGRMPKISEMDTSILGRCHTQADHVGHIKTEDMKNFVERVLTVICEL